MLIIDLFQRLKGVARMRASPESALMANALTACPTINRQFIRMHIALIPTIIFESIVHGLRASLDTRLLQEVELLSDFFHPPTVDNFVKMEGRATMRALRSLFCEPTANALITTQLGTMWAQMCVSQPLQAYKTARRMVFYNQSSFNDHIHHNLPFEDVFEGIWMNSIPSGL